MYIIYERDEVAWRDAFPAFPFAARYISNKRENNVLYALELFHRYARREPMKSESRLDVENI